MELNFKKYIDKSGLTQTKIAEMTGLSFPTINSLYKGSSKSIYFDTLEKLCNILKCTPNDLFGYKANEYDNIQSFNNRSLNYYMRMMSSKDDQVNFTTITNNDGEEFLVPCIPIKKDND